MVLVWGTGAWQTAVAEEEPSEFGVGEQEGVFVLFGAATRALQSCVLQRFPCGIGEQAGLDGSESAGAAFIAVFFVGSAQKVVGGGHKLADELGRGVIGQLEVEHVTRWLSPCWSEREQSEWYGMISGLSHGFDDLRFGDFFAGDAGDMCAFVQEFKQWRGPVKACAANDIADVVAAESGAGGQEDVVFAAFLQFVCFEDDGVG